MFIKGLPTFTMINLSNFTQNLMKQIMNLNIYWCNVSTNSYNPKVVECHTINNWGNLHKNNGNLHHTKSSLPFLCCFINKKCPFLLVFATNFQSQVTFKTKILLVVSDKLHNTKLKMTLIVDVKKIKEIRFHPLTYYICIIICD